MAHEAGAPVLRDSQRYGVQSTEYLVQGTTRGAGQAVAVPALVVRADSGVPGTGAYRVLCTPYCQLSPGTAARARCARHQSLMGAARLPSHYAPNAHATRRLWKRSNDRTGASGWRSVIWQLDTQQAVSRRTSSKSTR